MGGNAFQQLLPDAAFPRIPPAVYQSLKARLLPRLLPLYRHVAVPVEAPEKKDHGDLDFVVEGQSEGVSHTDVRAALGATVSIPMEGNRTSHFAVPIARGEWRDLGHAQEQEKYGDEEMYYQIDVHVCADKEEWERVVFFHAYGDLGMIMGLIARNNGFALGTKGLKVRIATHPRRLWSITYLYFHGSAQRSQTRLTRHLTCRPRLMPSYASSGCRWTRGSKASRPNKRSSSGSLGRGSLTPRGSGRRDRAYER